MFTIFRYLILFVIGYVFIKKILELLSEPIFQTHNGSSKNHQYRDGLKEDLKEQNDPYRVLGVKKGASQDEIKKAYLYLMSQYHPDKVAHLGEEIQKLAKNKSQEINLAYHNLI
jgi:DnaJ-domain-containing protein 1